MEAENYSTVSSNKFKYINSCM